MKVRHYGKITTDNDIYNRITDQTITYKLTQESDFNQIYPQNIIPLYLITDLTTGVTIPEYQDYILSILVDGTTPIYEWYKDGSIIFGATGNTFSILSATTAVEGNYLVKIRNDISFLQTVQCFIDVQTAFEQVYFITEPISAVTIKRTETTYISGEVGGDINYYEWIEDGIPVPSSNISGITITGIETGSTIYNLYVMGLDGNSILSSGTTITVINLYEYVYFINEPPSAVTIKLDQSIYISGEVGGDINYYDWIEDGTPTGINASGITYTGLETGSTLYNMYVYGLEGDAILSSGTTITVEDTIDFNPVYITGETFQSLTDIRSILFREDGLKFYVLNGGLLIQYDLNVAFDLTTANNMGSISMITWTGGAETVPRSIDISSDGAYFYMAGIATDRIYKGGLPTAWDISTINAPGSFSILAQENGLRDFQWSKDGTKLWIIGIVSEQVYQYTAATPFVLNTLSYDNISITLPQSALDPHGCVVASSDWGRQCFVITNATSGGTNRILEYKINKNDVSSYELRSNYSIDSSITTGARGLQFCCNDTIMYIWDASNIYKFSI